MSAKTHISAVLIATAILTGCVTTMENPDEIITKREYYEMRDIQNIATAISYFIVFAIATLAVEVSLDAHKVDDHGYTRVN